MENKIFLKIISLVGSVFIFGLSLSTVAYSESLSTRNKINMPNALLFQPQPDNRTVVEDPEECPQFSPIGTLVVTFPDGYVGRGTGFLIANNIVATAAHNIYSADHGGNASQIVFTPSESEFEHAPFGRSTNVDVRIPGGYFGSTPTLYDYAAIQIQTPLGFDSVANRFDMRMATAADLLQHNIRLTGYPGVVHGDPTEDMWTAVGASLLYSDGRRIRYSSITTSTGQSGSPIVLENDPRYVIGIHTAGGAATSNVGSGIFFTQEVYDFFTSVFK